MSVLYECVLLCYAVLYNYYKLTLNLDAKYCSKNKTVKNTHNQKIITIMTMSSKTLIRVVI